MYDLNALLIKVFKYDHPESIPVRFGCLPSAFKKYGDELNDLLSHYEFAENLADFSFVYNTPASFHTGKHTDIWGCEWETIIDGIHPLVTGHPIKCHDDIAKYRIPTAEEDTPHGFMYLRVQDLLGFENSMYEFADGTPEFVDLIDRIADYNVWNIGKHIDRYGDIAFFGDDLGIQTGIAIGARKWRKYFKNAFTRIYKVVHDAGKYVYMHTDGQIYEIIPDLHDAGVDIVNPQYRANGLENLVRVCKGKYPIDLDLDRQLFPFASAQELRDHVYHAIEAMYLPEGGLSICLELGDDVPLEKMRVILDAVNEYRMWR